MLRIFLILITILSTLASSIQTLSATTLDESRLYHSVLKIYSYEYDDDQKTFTKLLQWSAVYIGNNRILTNAHVILDKDGEIPVWRYEICRSIDYERDPICFTSARLIAYDKENDLALLSAPIGEVIPPVILSEKTRLPLWSPIIVYGYPQIGGETITRTAGRIAGYNRPFYKIDGIIDHGNSGGGAFDENGTLIGMPSEILSDNAVIGYMIAPENIRLFLSGSTLTYVSYKERPDEAFLTYIKNKSKERQNPYLIRDGLLSTLPLKWFHMRYEASYLGEKDGVMSYSFTHESTKTTLVLVCMKVVGDTKEYPFWQIGSPDEYRIEKANTDKTLVAVDYEDSSSEKRTFMVYDARTNCSIQTYGGIEEKTKNALRQDLWNFMKRGYSIKKTPVWGAFYTGSLFTLYPTKNSVIYEYMGRWNIKNIGIDIIHNDKKRDAITLAPQTMTSIDDFADDISYSSDSTPNSIEDLASLYRNNYTSVEVRTLETANHIPFLETIFRKSDGTIRSIEYRWYVKQKEKYIQIVGEITPSKQWTNTDTDSLRNMFTSSTLHGSSPW